MPNKLIWYVLFSFAMLVLCFLLYAASIAEAEIIPEDINDHVKVAKILNKIVDTIKQDRTDDRQDAKELRKYLKYQLEVDDKIVRKMINRGWVNTHSEVEP